MKYRFECLIERDNAIDKIILSADSYSEAKNRIAAKYPKEEGYSVVSLLTRDEILLVELFRDAPCSEILIMSRSEYVSNTEGFSAYTTPSNGTYSRKDGLNVFKVVGYGLALFSIVVALF